MAIETRASATNPALAACSTLSRNQSTSSRQTRSEEHTSELQSLRHLVCRLLLEKKKNTTSLTRFFHQRESLCGDDPDDQRYRFFFFFNDTATTEIYTLSLHDALPI